MHQIVIPPQAAKYAGAGLEAVDPRRTALVVVDLQAGFMGEGQLLTNPHARDIVPNVNRLARALRDAGGHVAFTRHTISGHPRFRLPEWQFRTMPRDEQGALIFLPGHPAHALYPDLDQQPDDIVVDKHRFSAFMPNSSDLHEILQARGVDTIVVTGTVTNVCCETTARDAHMLGYHVVFVADATAALSDEEHNASLLGLARIIPDIQTTEDVLASLVRQPEPA